MIAFKRTLPDICAGDFKNERLDIVVCDAFQVPVPHLTTHITQTQFSNRTNPEFRQSFLITATISISACNLQGVIMPKVTFLSQIWSGLLPMLYRIDKNPLWNVFLNITDYGAWRILVKETRKLHNKHSHTTPPVQSSFNDQRPSLGMEMWPNYVAQ